MVQNSQRHAKRTMTNRAEDWLSQAEHDLAHARNSRGNGDYDWACFAAHQAAEKAVKAFFLSLGCEAWGHSVLKMFRDLEQRVELPPGLINAARRLDKHYIPTRYPNGFDSGAPHIYYTSGKAEEAIADAGRIYQFCSQSIH